MRRSASSSPRGPRLARAFGGGWTARIAGSNAWGRRPPAPQAGRGLGGNRPGRRPGRRWRARSGAAPSLSRGRSVGKHWAVVVMALIWCCDAICRSGGEGQPTRSGEGLGVRRGEDTEPVRCPAVDPGGDSAEADSEKDRGGQVRQIHAGRTGPGPGRRQAGGYRRLGMATTVIPALTPDRMPLAESSIAAQASGGTCSLSAAAR